MAINLGKQFEEQLKAASDRVEDLFFYRIKDVNQMSLKPGHRVSKNLYDAFIYKKPNLIPVELKSVDADRTKTIGFQLSKDDKTNKHIKWHQIDSLKKSIENEGVIAGFIFNFRYEDHEETYFVHISDFTHYMDVASGKIESTYKSKVNAKSFPIRICEEIGVPIKSVKLQKKYSYHMKDFVERLQEKYNNKEENK